MSKHISSNAGTQVNIPSIRNHVDDFTHSSMTDYNYKVNAVGNKGTKREFQFDRIALAFIRKNLKEIAKNGYSENVKNHPINKRYSFVAINLHKAGFKDVELSDADIYVQDNETKERIHFNMKDVVRVRGINFASTGRRNVESHRSVKKNGEVVVNSVKKNNTNTTVGRSRVLTEEQRKENKSKYAREYYKRNREKIREQNRNYYLNVVKKNTSSANKTIVKNNNNTSNNTKSSLSEERKAYMREWKKKNSEHIKAYNRARYQKIKNNEPTVTRKSMSAEESKERIRESARRSYYKNRESRIAYAREWRKNNPEKTRTYQQRYNQKRRSSR